MVETLRKLADSGKTVVSVIHQPSQSVFAMFDDLLLIAEGKMMYYGEVANVRSYMDGLGFGCEKEVGTAEHVLEIVSRVEGGGIEDNIAGNKNIQRPIPVPGGRNRQQGYREKIDNASRVPQVLVKTTKK